VERRFFFLSHAHAPDGDGLITELFEDICLRVRDATGLSDDEAVGFVARTDRLRGAALERTNRELARSRVLVPLYSPRYLTSPDCGRVVSAFVHLHAPSARNGPWPVAPLLWHPTLRPMPPEPVQPIDVPDADRYDDAGLFELMVSRPETEAYRSYDAVLDELTRRITASTRAAPPTNQRVIDVARFPSAFARSAPPPRVHIGVLAPDLGRLPTGRDRGQYGNDPLQWNPYVSDASEGLGSRMKLMAHQLGYRPTLSAVNDVELDLCSATAPTSPVILLLDPWALEVVAWRDQLVEFDRQDRPWITVMAAWNAEDPQTARDSGRLLKQLDATLESRFQRRRPGLRLDAKVAPTLQGFGRMLPTVLQEATRRYVRWINGPASSTTRHDLENRRTPNWGSRPEGGSDERT
jgi:FxsC-like protein